MNVTTAGNYTVIVTNSSGCQDSETGNILAAVLPQYTITPVTSTCFSACNGSISITSSTPFTVDWITSPYQLSTAAVLNDVCPGTYNAIITFSGGCSVNTNVTVSGVTYTTIIPTNSNPVANWNSLTPVYVSNTIVVNNGQVLNISGSQVYFDHNAGIEVMPGGKLNVADFSVLSNACPTLWKGIAVRHDQTQLTQTAANSGVAKFTKYCTIQNALIGIRNGQLLSAVPSDNNINAFESNLGGIIQCELTTFKNNKRDLEIKYNNETPFIENSYFKRCTFLTNANIISDNYSFWRVFLKYVKALTFEGCKWENTLPAIYNIASWRGIKSLNSKYSITSYVVQNVEDKSKFIGLFRAINSQNDELASVGVQYYCYQGVYASGLKTASMFSSNTFSAPNTPVISQISTYLPSDANTNPSYSVGQSFINLLGAPYQVVPVTNGGPSYGLYLEGGDKYKVQANMFNLVGTPEILRVGLYVRNNNKGVDVWGNRFEGNTIGASCFDKNRDAFDDYGGLCFSCNVFRNNDLDLLVNSAGNVTPDVGIRKNLRSPNLASLGNQFLDVNVGSYFQWDQVSNYTSVAHNIKYTGTNLVPTECSPNFSPTQTTSQISCKFSSVGLNGTALLASKNAFMEDAQMILNVLESLVDFGNPDSLIHAIKDNDYLYAVSMYMDLLENAHQLSPEAIVELIKKEYTLPNDVLSLILHQAPVASKTSWVMLELNDRLNQLSQVQMDYALQGTGEDPVTNLQHQLIQLNDSISWYSSQLLYLYHTDSAFRASNLGATESLSEGLMDENSFRSRIMNKVTYEQYPEALSWCDTLLNNTKLSRTFHVDLETSQQLISSLIYMDWTDSTSVEDLRITLTNTDYSVYNLAGEIAQYGLHRILGDSAEIVYWYPLIPVEERVWMHQPSKESTSAFTLYPNPCKDQILAQGTGLHWNPNRWTIVNEVGQEILSGSIPSGIQSIWIDTRSLASGTYWMRFSNGAQQSSQSFIKN